MAGMVRLLFNRKHKTLHAVLTTKSCLSLLEENMKTHASLHHADDMAVCSSSVDMKAVVEEVLTAEGYSDKRAARLDINDFLCLLAAFNAKGVHFA